MLMRAIVDPGDRVAFPVPTYSLYDTLVAVQGGEAVHVPFPDDLRLPPALRGRGGAGHVPLQSELAVGDAGAARATSRRWRARSRACWWSTRRTSTSPTRARSAWSVACPNVVVLRTFSKSFSLAGLRIGLAFGHPELLAGLHTVKDSYNLSRLTQVGGDAALADVPAMQANVARIRATRARLTEALERLGYVVPPSQANFVLARRPGVDQAPVAAALAARGVLVRHFATPRLCDALRITVGTDDEIDVLLSELADLAG